jgi:hypothetical protein
MRFVPGSVRLEKYDATLCKAYVRVRAQQRADRIDRAVVLTPPPPTGFGADEAAIKASCAMAEADAAIQLGWLPPRLGTLVPRDRSRRVVPPGSACKSIVVPSGA